MSVKRHRVWHWFFLGTLDGSAIPSVAFVMDDFGNLTQTDNRAFYSLHAGCVL